MSVHASLKECSVPIKTDFLSKRENEVPAEHEILIGKNNREESLDVLDSLDTSDPDKIFYTVLAVNGKLVIIGANDEGTAKLFLAEYNSAELRAISMTHGISASQSGWMLT
mgnify:CR=1 FL=1